MSEPQPTDEVVALKNGAQVPKKTAHAIWINLGTLWRSTDLADQLALVDLVSVARDSSYVVHPLTAQVLIDQRLIQQTLEDGTVVVHQYVRDVVLSAVEGDSIQSVLMSPFAD